MIKKNKFKIYILGAIVSLIIIRICVEPFRIVGDCMEPTIKDGRLYFFNRISSYFHTYKVNDIILYNYEGKVWVSRIVALDNDTVQLTEGSIVLNGKKLENNGIDRDWVDWKYGVYAIDKPLKIEQDHVFVLSDKLSAHHDDSRVFGPISKNAIIGLLL